MKIIFILSVFISLLFAKPEWISNPTQDGTILAAVGMADAHYPDSIKRKIALMQAKGKISHLINLHVEVETNLYDKSTNENTTSELSSKSSLSSNNTIKITVKNSYEDDDGTLYLWVVAE
jgi:hypothetical protein